MTEYFKRYSGILMHPTSLPGRFGIGDFGKEAYDFIDFLEKSGQTIWQVLPFGHTGFGDSPYQAFSAFAGQPLLISPEKLLDEGLLDEQDLTEYPDINSYSVEYGEVINAKTKILKKAYESFIKDTYKARRTKLERIYTDNARRAFEKSIACDMDMISEDVLEAADEIDANSIRIIEAEDRVPDRKCEPEAVTDNLWSITKEGFEAFCEKEAYWLDDYALFMAGKEAHEGRCWLEWESDLREGIKKVKKIWSNKLSASVGYYKFIQYIFEVQWSELRAYANEKGIMLVGDMPIFVSMDSADVWSDRQLFLLESDGYPKVVAGVPPDYFSATGQLWGNPLYDWRVHKRRRFDWWIKRIEKQLEWFDFIRIDHFRGFEAYYAIPYGEENAINGKWCPGPGADLFDALKERFGEELPVWAEDLGIITPPVEKLRDDYNLPGMKVLQFAFSDEKDNNLLPHHFTTENCICYTGTHDNATTVGWYFEEADDVLRDRVRRYMNTDGRRIHMDFIRTAMASVAKYAVFPIQDLLGFGNDCRMNTPSVAGGNWTFRYRKECLTDGLAYELRAMTELYGRGVKIE